MKILRMFFSWTLIYNIVNFIGNTIQYIKDYLYIADTFYSDAFKIVLKRYLNLDVKKDWIGRLYGVINPNIDINGNLDITKVIIEIDGDNTNSNEYVKTWCMKQLIMVGNLFKIQNLYNFIDLDFKHVGPANGDNYLLVFDMVSRKKFTKSLKRCLIQAILYIIVVLGLIFFVL